MTTAKTAPAPDNMRVWNEVCETDPADTKQVDFGRKFTAIKAYSQIQKATELWGPCGVGWGWRDLEYTQYEWDGQIMILARLKLWYENVEQFVDVTGSDMLVAKTKSGLRFDDDAHKKALTDALTKGLSYLGFSADIFTGHWDNKYVDRQKRDANGDGQRAKESPPSGSDKPHERAQIWKDIIVAGADVGVDEAGVRAHLKTHYANLTETPIPYLKNLLAKIKRDGASALETVDVSAPPPASASTAAQIPPSSVSKDDVWRAFLKQFPHLKEPEVQKENWYKLIIETTGGPETKNTNWAKVQAGIATFQDMPF